MSSSLITPTPAPVTRGVLPLLAFVTVVAVLYFAREFFLPLALSALISFLLIPLIRLLERWRLKRIPAVLVATALAFSVIGGVLYIIAGQLIDVANDLDTYKSNLNAKILSLKTTDQSPLSKATRTFRELAKEVTKTDATPAPAKPAAALDPSKAKLPAPASQSPGSIKPADAAHSPNVPATPPTTASTAPSSSETDPPKDGDTKAPVQVAVISTPGNAWETLKTFIAPIAGPLGMAAVVIVLVIFTLLEREDLRDRIIHLIGRGRLHVTTQALDEAGERVSRYLVAQCLVNLTYGIPIGLGLWIIGIPNAVLWGLLAAILRFVPYIGAWIAAAFPLALSLAVSPSWNMPLLVLSLFVVVELISNNVVEPWLYGSSTGLSPMAIIVAALFWTWLWGGVGLLLATPLTVCLSVIGKYIPQLSFLEVLLGDRPPIAASDRFYQRLLALDEIESVSLCQDYAEKNSLTKTFDEVIGPALVLVDEEHRGGKLDETSRREIHRLIREAIVTVGEEAQEAAAKEAKKAGVTLPVSNGTGSFLCLPASNESDELGALMLTQLLALGGLKADPVSSKALAGEMLEAAALQQPKLLCISAVPPGSALPAQHLCRRLRERLGKETRIMVGLWNESPGETVRGLDRFKRAQADEVFFTFAAAAQEILLQADCVVRVVSTEPQTALPASS